MRVFIIRTEDRLYCLAVGSDRQDTAARQVVASDIVAADTVVLVDKMAVDIVVADIVAFVLD